MRPRTAALLALLPLCGTAACASGWQRSNDRWRGYHQAATPYVKWAECVSDRSDYYLARYGPNAASAPEGTDAQLFTSVLADCRQHMSGSRWDSLPDRQMKRLIGDAWQEFSNIKTEKLAIMGQGII